MRLVFLLTPFLLTCSLSHAQEEQVYAEQAEQVQMAQQQTKVALEESQALVCYLKDHQAVEDQHPDVPEGWSQPEITVYDKEGATCSQLPARREAELVARAAVEADPEHAVQVTWSVEVIWENKGGPVIPQSPAAEAVGP